MRIGGSKIQTILVLSMFIILLLGFSGVIPEEYFGYVFIGSFGSIIGYILVSFMYPFFKVAGKPFIAVSFYKSSSEYEWVFGKVKEYEGGTLFRECPGGSKKFLCTEIEPVPFLSTHVPYRLIVLWFPREVNPESLFDNDYVEPDTGFGKIPIRIAYLSGVQVGEIVLTEKTAFKSLGDKFKEFLGKEVERIERTPIVFLTRFKEKVNKFFKQTKELNIKIPIVMTTGFKVEDIETLTNIVEKLKSETGFHEVNGAKVWIDEVGKIKIISTELEELRADNMKLRQMVKGLEKVYQTPPTITVATFNLEEESPVKEKVMKYSGIILGAVALGLILMLILGLI